MKLFFKLLGISLVGTLFFIMASGVLPFSPSFKEGAQNSDPLDLIFVIIVHLWFTATVYYIGTQSDWSKKWLIGSLIFVYATVYSFMTQIETLFFSDAFQSLSSSDAWVIMLTNSIPILVIVPWTLSLTKRSPLATSVKIRLRFTTILGKVALLALLYGLIYFLFGYFVAWQFPDLRVFYSGTTEKLSFVDHMISNFQSSSIVSFQLLRGALFSLFILPIVLMFYDQSKALLVSLILIYLSTAIVLIIPNFLFPDAVRWVHFIEMMSSMTLFAVITWWVWRKPGENRK